MISCVVVFDGWVTCCFITTHTRGYSVPACDLVRQDRSVEKLISKLRNSHRSGRLIFRAFQCEMELGYITVSRLLLVPVAKVL